MAAAKAGGRTKKAGTATKAKSKAKAAAKPKAKPKAKAAAKPKAKPKATSGSATTKRPRARSKTKARSRTDSFSNNGIVIVDDDMRVDPEKVNAERRAYLDEARSQEADAPD